MSTSSSKIGEAGRHTTGGDGHRVGVDHICDLALGTDGEEGSGHEGDGVLEGRHSEWLIMGIIGRCSLWVVSCEMVLRELDWINTGQVSTRPSKRSRNSIGAGGPREDAGKSELEAEDRIELIFRTYRGGWRAGKGVKRGEREARGSECC